jgi:hypothetical protein
MPVFLSHHPSLRKLYRYTKNGMVSGSLAYFSGYHLLGNKLPFAPKAHVEVMMGSCLTQALLTGWKQDDRWI